MELEDDAGVLTGIRSLHEQKLLHDYTIEVEDQEFRVHKLVMASASDYFKVMLTGGMVESQTDRVRLEGLNAIAVAKMIDFIYTGEFFDDRSTVEDLTECAVYLQIQTAIGNCIHTGRCQLELDGFTGCFEMLSMFQRFSLNEGVEMVLEKLIEYFSEALEHWTPEEMTHHDVKNLIDIWQNSEWDLFSTIKQWVEVDSENRQQHVSELMNHLRFALMTPEQLEVVKGSDLYSRCHGLWHEEVGKAVEYHSLSTDQKVLDGSKQSIVRNEPSPFYFNSDGHVLYELGIAGKSGERFWKRLEAVDNPEMKHGIETFVVVNNFLVVCETFHTDQEWHILDPRTMKWLSMAELTIPRRDSALVSCNKHLYVLGGRPQGVSQSTVPSDTIETYNFETNSWSTISNKLPIPVSKHGAAVLDGRIYVAGGWMSNGQLSPRFDCLDTTTGTWHRKPTLPIAESYRGLQVMQHNEEDVLFIMCDKLAILYYSPSKCGWFKWDCAKDVYGTKLRWHSGAYVLSNKNITYLLNFLEGGNRDDNSDNDQRTVGTCATWTYDSSLNHTSEWKLERFPVIHAGIESYHKAFTRLMLLAVPPPPTLPLNMS